MVPILGTRRRLRALQALGYPLESLARELGYTRNGPQSLGMVLYGEQAGVRREFAAQVTTLYERLAAKPGPSRSTRLRALGAGHATPAQWRGANLDDPAAVPAAGPTLRRLVPSTDRATTVPAPECRTGDPDQWFSSVESDIAAAVRACRRCPLRRECLGFALVHGEDNGVWGGILEDQRTQLRAQLVDQLGENAPLADTPELEAVLDQYTSLSGDGIAGAGVSGA
jgi:hypothetical protein